MAELTKLLIIAWLMGVVFGVVGVLLFRGFSRG